MVARRAVRVGLLTAVPVLVGTLTGCLSLTTIELPKVYVGHPVSAPLESSGAKGRSRVVGFRAPCRSDC